MWVEAALVELVDQIDLLDLVGEVDLVDLTDLADPADLLEGVGLAAQVALVVVGFDLPYFG